MIALGNMSVLTENVENKMRPAGFMTQILLMPEFIQCEDRAPNPVH